MKLETYPGGVYFVDFEYHPKNGREGNAPDPVCMVVAQFGTSNISRYWQDELRAMECPPFPVDAAALFVAYYAPAELDCFLVLGWPMPVNVLDLYAEFRCVTNGRDLSQGRGLLGALLYFGIGGISFSEKDAMRDLILGRGPWTLQQQTEIMSYCESDVLALAELFLAMLPQIDLPRALLRGAYMAAVSKIQAVGTPIDVGCLEDLKANWENIQDKLITEIDKDFGVYEGRSFRTSKFVGYLQRHSIPWPVHATGRLDLADDTFRDMAQVHPQLSPLRELRTSLSSLRLSTLTVGEDGRNRCMLSPFSSKTGRNQPSNAKYIFGPAVWMRGLIKPLPGMSVAYLDWSQQEFGIAAVLSGDIVMQEAYRSGDPYLALAKQSGAVPLDATKASHPAERERFKACVLAVQYGMGAESLALRINQSKAHAQVLLDLHRRTYPKFWKWSDSLAEHFALGGTLQTTFGWPLNPHANPNLRSVRNFPMQAAGAEMLRIACILLADAGIRVCAPVHDAVLIETPTKELKATVGAAQDIMQQASEIVLSGFALRSDAGVVSYPHRYMDPRGRKMWEKVAELLGWAA